MQTSKQKIDDEKKYPGAAIDAANNDKVNTRLEKEYTKSINNNPRNEGQII